MENKLIDKIKNGDESGLDELIALYYPVILRYCHWHTETHEAAEDATQQTFINFFEHFYQYNHSGKLKSYLYSIARNVCINCSKHKKTEELPDEFSREERGYDEVESNIDMELLLRPLPDEHKELVQLKYTYGLKLREISEITGLPLRTVQSKLRKATKTIEKNFRTGWDR